MKGVSLATVAACCFATACSAIQLQKPAGTPKVVSLDFYRQTRPSSRLRLRKRQDKGKNITAPLSNIDELFYFTDVSVGTPPQPLRMLIDTGSSDFWVNTPSSDLCSNASVCAMTGVYNANLSSTYQYVDGNFDIQYADGTGADGDYIKDTLAFGTTQITGLQMGVGYDSFSPQNVWGIGYPSNEAGDVYPNTAFQMVIDGLIQSPAYSLWLNDQESGSGSILFGGVDSSQYVPPLQILPVVPDVTYPTNIYYDLQINLTSNSVTSNGTTVSLPSQYLPAPVLLDSGTTACFLPDSTVQSIYTTFGAIYNVTQEEATCSCDLANNPGTVDFNFAGKIINVPIREFVRQPSALDPTYGGSECLFDLLPGDGEGYLLGDSFLRSAYVVYDLNNNEIGLAQTIFNSAGTDILEIVNGTNGIPNPTTAPGSTATGTVSLPGATISGEATGTVTGITATGSGKPTSTTYKGAGGRISPFWIGAFSCVAIAFLLAL